MEGPLMCAGRCHHPIWGVFACAFNQILDEAGRQHKNVVFLRSQISSKRSKYAKEYKRKTKLLNSFDTSLKRAKLERNSRDEIRYREYCISIDREVQMLEKDVELYSYFYTMCGKWLEKSNERFDCIKQMSYEIKMAKWEDLKQGTLFKTPNVPRGTLQTKKT